MNNKIKKINLNHSFIFFFVVNIFCIDVTRCKPTKQRTPGPPTRPLKCGTSSIFFLTWPWYKKKIFFLPTVHVHIYFHSFVHSAKITFWLMVFNFPDYLSIVVVYLPMWYTLRVSLLRVYDPGARFRRPTLSEVSQIEINFLKVWGPVYLRA